MTNTQNTTETTTPVLVLSMCSDHRYVALARANMIQHPAEEFSDAWTKFVDFDDVQTWDFPEFDADDADGFFNAQNAAFQAAVREVEALPDCGRLVYQAPSTPNPDDDAWTCAYEDARELTFERQRELLQMAVEAQLAQAGVPMVTMCGERWESHRDNWAAAILCNGNEYEVAEACIEGWYARDPR